MRFPRGIRGEFRAHCINFLRNGKRESHRSRAVRGQKWGNGGATGRTNKHFTLKENPLKRSDLDDFVACYNPKNRHERKESERFRAFAYEGQQSVTRNAATGEAGLPLRPRHVDSFVSHTQSA